MENWRRRIAEVQLTLDELITWRDFRDIRLTHNVHGTFSGYSYFQELLLATDGAVRRGEDFALSFEGVKFLTQESLQNPDTCLVYSCAYCNDDFSREEFGAIREIQEWKHFYYMVQNSFVLNGCEPYQFEFCYNKNRTRFTTLSIWFRDPVTSLEYDCNWSKDGF